MIFAIVNSSLSLALKCAKVAKSLHDIASKYKKAELDIKLLVQQINIIKEAWDRVGTWTQSLRRASLPSDESLLARIDQSLECGDLAVTALEKDLEQLTGRIVDTDDEDAEATNPGVISNITLSVKQRSKVLWNEAAFNDHRERIRDQSLSMSLLLQVMNL